MYGASDGDGVTGVMPLSCDRLLLGLDANRLCSLVAITRLRTRPSRGPRQRWVPKESKRVSFQFLFKILTHRARCLATLLVLYIAIHGLQRHHYIYEKQETFWITELYTLSWFAYSRPHPPISIGPTHCGRAAIFSNNAFVSCSRTVKHPKSPKCGIAITLNRFRTKSTFQHFHHHGIRREATSEILVLRHQTI